MRGRSQTAYSPSSHETDPSGEFQDSDSEQSTLGDQVDETGSEAAQPVRRAGEAIAERVGTARSGVIEKGSALANNAVQKAQSLAADLEAFTQRRPLSALAGALLAGIVVGLLRRKRS